MHVLVFVGELRLYKDRLSLRSSWNCVLRRFHVLLGFVYKVLVSQFAYLFLCSVIA